MSYKFRTFGPRGTNRDFSFLWSILNHHAYVHILGVLQYADQWSRVRKLLISSKMSCYAALINENKSDSKVLFNTKECLLHQTPQKHYPSCGCPKELCDKFADFFSEKIVTIRHQLDTLSITDAPVFCIDWWRHNYMWIERIFSHLRGWTFWYRENAPNRVLLILYLLPFYVFVSIIYYLLLKEP